MVQSRADYRIGKKIESSTILDRFCITTSARRTAACHYPQQAFAGWHDAGLSI